VSADEFVDVVIGDRSERRRGLESTSSTPPTSCTPRAPARRLWAIARRTGVAVALDNGRELHESTAMTRVAVTGGSGYIAGWCIAQLLDEGYEVITTIRSLQREADVRAAVGAATSTRQLSFGVADLSRDEGWDDALAGCAVVLHVASPMSTGDADADTMITETVDGTLRVLAAADRVGARRVVMTSSCAAATPVGSQLSGVVDETCWTNPDERGLSAYRRSKTIGERAAWEFVAESRGFSLATILPAAVLGPARSPTALGPLGLIGALLDGSAMAIPRLGFEIVDVRDVAAAHLLAMTSTEAEGQRFIVSGEQLWLGDIADILRTHLGDKASSVPSATLTDDEFRSIAKQSPDLVDLLPLLGRELEHSSARAQGVLGWRSRPAAATVVDSARCLLSYTS
jgi:dihydroflavonol-4-reductase